MTRSIKRGDRWLSDRATKYQSDKAIKLLISSQCSALRRRYFNIELETFHFEWSVTESRNLHLLREAERRWTDVRRRLGMRPRDSLLVLLSLWGRIFVVNWEYNQNWHRGNWFPRYWWTSFQDLLCPSLQICREFISRTNALRWFAYLFFSGKDLVTIFQRRKK